MHRVPNADYALAACSRPVLIRESPWLEHRSDRPEQLESGRFRHTREPSRGVDADALDQSRYNRLTLVHT